MNTDNFLPAFPTWIADDGMAQGMSLRDYVAANVLLGMCSGDWKLPIDDQTWAKAAATRCFEIADEFMEARKNDN
jgi:hypothetical protein